MGEEGTAFQLANRKREPSEVIIDILKAASGDGATMTTLVYRSNSNFVRAKKYVELLIARGLLERSGNPTGVYRTTSSGEKAAGTLAGMDQLLFGRQTHDDGHFGFLGPAPPQEASLPLLDADEVSVSFARLRSVCSQRHGNLCSLGGGECRLESCPLIRT